MSNLLTTQQRTRQAIDWRNGFASNKERSYFMFIGHPRPWDTTDEMYQDEWKTPTFVDSTREHIDCVDQIIAAKQVFSTDASVVVDRIPWENGIVYDIFDQDADLIANKSKFYVVTSDYNVYKCISNNEDSVSVIMPNAETTEEQITSDGYIWKFLYKIREELYDFITTSGGAFGTGYIPVEVLPEEVGAFDSRILQRNVELSAIHGEVQEIILQQVGTAYPEAIVSGSAISSDSGTTDSTGSTEADSTDLLEGDKVQLTSQIGSNQIKLNINGNAKSIDDNYNDNYVLHITSGTGKGTIRVIKDYTESGVCVVDPISTIIESGSTYDILPRVEIKGNGSGAVALAELDPDTKKFTNIDIVLPGENYTTATVKVYQTGNELITTETTTAKAIISPPGGHGKYIPWELGARAVMVKSSLDNTTPTNNNRSIPTCQYHQIGLIGNLRENDALTDQESDTLMGVDVINPKRKITIDNEYKQQTVWFNECSYHEDAGVERLQTSDFEVGGVVKQGPDNSASQARGIVLGWELQNHTAPADYDSGCGCADLGPEGEDIVLGKLTIDVVQGEFKGCGSTLYSIVREDWTILESTDAGGTDATVADSTMPHTLTSVTTSGEYFDDTFVVGHYIMGDESKIVGKVTSWQPADSGNIGVLEIDEISKQVGATEDAVGWAGPTYDSQGNVVSGELVHYFNDIDEITGILDIDNGRNTTTGRITAVETLQELQDELLLSGTVVIQIKSVDELVPITDAAPSFILGESIYQQPTDAADDGILGEQVTAQGTIAGFWIDPDDATKTTGFIEVVAERGTFYEDTTDVSYSLISTNEPYIIGITLGTSGITVTDVQYSEFNKKYGYNLLYIQNIDTIQRADNQTDTSKVVVEF